MLHLAAKTMESRVDSALDQLLRCEEPFDYAAVRAVVTPERPSVPEVRIGTPNLGVYDQLIAEAGR